MVSNRGECRRTIFSKESVVRMTCYVFLCMLLLAKEIRAEKSVLECDNMSGEVFYDPKTKRCLCDLSKCYRSITTKWNVTEERCYKLSINCDPGMEPTHKETECKPCYHGMYKPTKGCDYCVPWTKCSETEWIDFPGNVTMDRNCTTTAPEIVNTTPANVFNQSSPHSSDGPQEGTTTSPHTTHGIPVTDKTDKSGQTNYSGRTMAGNWLLSFYVLCWFVLLSAIFYAGFKNKAQASSDDRRALIPTETKSDLETKRSDQAYVLVLQVDEEHTPTEKQRQNEVPQGGADDTATVADTLQDESPDDNTVLKTECDDDSYSFGPGFGWKSLLSVDKLNNNSAPDKLPNYQI